MNKEYNYLDNFGYIRCGDVLITYKNMYCKKYYNYYYKLGIIFASTKDMKVFLKNSYKSLYIVTVDGEIEIKVINVMTINILRKTVECNMTIKSKIKHKGE